jgi:hypothetical protein
MTLAAGFLRLVLIGPAIGVGSHFGMLPLALPFA